MAALPDYPEALWNALAGIKSLERVETLELSQAVNRVLAEGIKADRDLPPFNRAQMDGYALRWSDFKPGRSWRVAHVLSAGTAPAVRVPPGECVAIATGAALPDDVDTVIQHELSDRGDRNGRPVTFTVDTVLQWNAVHRRGADAKSGDTLIPPQTVLRPQHLGIAASVGVTRVAVASRPRVAIITSGDEVVEPDTPLDRLHPHQIRNSNQVMIAGLLERIGAEVVMLHHARDDRSTTIQTVADCIAVADLVVTIGGVSAGDRDHFPDAFSAANIATSLQGASIQPGRPVIVGRAPNGTTIVGLPGNPVSALACSCLFVWPMIRILLGLDAAVPWRDVELTEPVKPNASRRAFRPATLLTGERARVPRWAGSGDLAHTAKTDGLLELPVQTEMVAAGSRLRFLPWP